LQLSYPNQLAVTTLLKSSEILKDVVVLSGKRSKCKTHHFPDHENYLETPSSCKRVYLNNAKYLRAGHNLYVDRVFSNAVINGIYSFHRSAAVYAKF
jgi:hypothetical protein